MNTTHTQPTGTPATIGDKWNTLVDICNASIYTSHRIIQEIDKLPLDENSLITVYAVGKPLVCFEASIDDALIAVQKWQSEITK